MVIESLKRPLHHPHSAIQRFTLDGLQGGRGRRHEVTCDTRSLGLVQRATRSCKL